MSSQERQKSKPWEAEGISRATWYRRRRETTGETEVASHTPRTPVPGETGQTKTETAAETAETAPAQSPDQEAEKEVIETVSGAGEPPETPPSALNDPWALSATDLARRAERYRTARKEKGELVASRGLKWALQDAGVPYERLQQEVDRIRQLARH